MTSSTEKQMITIQILTNISRKKSNQTMKIVQLIERNMRDIFLQNSCRKIGRDNSSIPFLLFKKSFT